MSSCSLLEFRVTSPALVQEGVHRRGSACSTQACVASVRILWFLSGETSHYVCGSVDKEKGLCSVDFVLRDIIYVCGNVGTRKAHVMWTLSR